MTRLRFTDCAKWQDPWFLNLPPIGKLFWQYLCDKCDNAGVVHLSPKLIAVELGEPVDLSTALTEWFLDRIYVLPNGKWHLKKFVRFQHPSGLSVDSAVHRQVIRCMESHGLHDFIPSQMRGFKEGRVGGSLHGRLIARTKAEDKDITKDKDKDKDPVFDGMDQDEASVIVSESTPPMELNWRDWRSQHGAVFVARRGDDGDMEGWEEAWKVYGLEIFNAMYAALNVPGKKIYFNNAILWFETNTKDVV